MGFFLLRESNPHPPLDPSEKRLHTSVKFQMKLPGAPLLVMRNGKPYTKGILQGYDDNGKGKCLQLFTFLSIAINFFLAIYSYFDVKTCDFFKKMDVICEPLPENEVTEKSQFQIPLYTGEPRDEM